MAEIASSPAGQTEGQGAPDGPSLRPGQLELHIPAPTKPSQVGSSGKCPCLWQRSLSSLWIFFSPGAKWHRAALDRRRQVIPWQNRHQYLREMYLSQRRAAECGSSYSWSLKTSVQLLLVVTAGGWGERTEAFVLIIIHLQTDAEGGWEVRREATVVTPTRRQFGNQKRLAVCLP